MSPSISISSRESLNNASMIAPAAQPAKSLRLRPISLGSLELLRQMDNPLASGADAAELDMHTIAEFIWVHAAPLEEAIETVFNHSAQVSQSVARFCMQVSPADIRNIAASLSGEQASILAASAIPLPNEDDSDSSPNALSHP